MDEREGGGGPAAPSGYGRAGHGGAYAAGLGPLFVLRGEEEIRLGLRIADRHCNTGGHAHGGLVASLADLGLIHAVSVARERRGEARAWLGTVSLAVDYLGPAPVGAWLEIRARVTRLGQRLAFVEGPMLADGAHVARASAVFSIRAPRP